MKEETRKAVFLGLVIAVFLSITVVATGVLVTKKGTGTMDVEVAYVVTDVPSGDPIGDAIIMLREGNGEDNAASAEQIVLRTDRSGIASQVIRKCRVYGSSGVLENETVIKLPSWALEARADGYPVVAGNLDELEPRRLTEREGKLAMVLIPIRLMREHEEVKEIGK
jgi:hypothetical protein